MQVTTKYIQRRVKIFIKIIEDENAKGLDEYSSWLFSLKFEEHLQRNIPEYTYFHRKNVSRFLKYVDPLDEDYCRKISDKFTELFLNTYCPKCKCVFVDWDGCMNFVCRNSLCKNTFCGRCLIFNFTKDTITYEHGVECCQNILIPSKSYYCGRCHDMCRIFYSLCIEHMNKCHAQVRFIWMKDSISLIDQKYIPAVIVKLYENSKGTLMEDLIRREYYPGQCLW